MYFSRSYPSLNVDVQMTTTQLKERYALCSVFVRTHQQCTSKTPQLEGELRTNDSESKALVITVADRL